METPNPSGYWTSVCPHALGSSKGGLGTSSRAWHVRNEFGQNWERFPKMHINTWQALKGWLNGFPMPPLSYEILRHLCSYRGYFLLTYASVTLSRTVPECKGKSYKLKVDMSFMCLASKTKNFHGTWDFSFFNASLSINVESNIWPRNQNPRADGKQLRPGGLWNPASFQVHFGEREHLRGSALGSWTAVQHEPWCALAAVQ